MTDTQISFIFQISNAGVHTAQSQDAAAAISFILGTWRTSRNSGLQEPLCRAWRLRVLG